MGYDKLEKINNKTFEIKEKVGPKLTKLSKDQADYISVKQEGPYKPDAYRY